MAFTVQSGRAIALGTRSAFSRPALTSSQPCKSLPAYSQDSISFRSHSTVFSGKPIIRRTSQIAAASSKDENLMGVELDISIKGMMCGGCTSRVQEALEKADGVSKVQVNLEQGMATVDVKVPSQLEAFAMLPKLVEAVKALGFEAEPRIAGL